MIESVEMPNPVGKERRGKVLMFTGCSTAIRINVRHPQSKPVPWDDDKRWSSGLYVWADVENEYGLKRHMGLMLPVKVLDAVLAEMHLPLMSENGKHRLTRQLVLQALNRHSYDILWRTDDENGRVIYDLTMRDTRCAIKDEL